MAYQDRVSTMVQEGINKFDLVISDVYVPDINGFRLLELVGLEMDLLVISAVMSGNGETSSVMKGIMHGARMRLSSESNSDRRIEKHLAACGPKESTGCQNHVTDAERGGGRGKREAECNRGCGLLVVGELCK